MSNLAVLSPVSSLDEHERLASEITLLAGQINAANYRLLKLIAAFDECQGWGGGGGGTVRSCAHWLNWKCGIALGAAREKVRVANCLSKLPLIDAAFATGEISYSKVRAMTRVATPENEDFLLTIARHGTASHVEQVVNKYRRVRGATEDAVEREQEEARKLVYYRDDDGMWVIHAKLPPEAGSIVVKAIEAISKPVQEARQEELRQQRADVSAETPSGENENTQPKQYQELMEQTRADALIQITEHFLATCGDRDQWQGLKGSERCQVMLHVDINTLKEHSPATHPAQEHCHLDEKQWLSPKTARRLACDASLVTVLEDEQGNVLNIGRRTRTVPASISRALSLRDTTCRFPGCCEKRYVDAHHIKHWADGGVTSLDNLATLCRYHHRQLHKGHFSIEMQRSNGESTLMFHTATGEPIETSLVPQFPGVSAETSAAKLRDAAPTVTPTTCISQWRGESCDYGMAIDALLSRDASKRD
jgi:hypothetical protein